MPKIFLSVGEPSGDLHGANLIRALARQDGDLRCLGLGGPRMRAAGCELICDLTEQAVMWVSRVILQLPRFLQLLRRVDEVLRSKRPAIVVLIDYPGFNWHVARRAKRLGIPVVYYGTPQLWAWAPWRIKKMRRTVDLALCKLPFEASWFRDRGMSAEYVGHPYFDELLQRAADHEFVQALRRDPSPLITLLPGSRTQEVHSVTPWLLAACQSLMRSHPAGRFCCASFNQLQADIVRQLADRMGVPLQVHVDRTPELIEAATCCLACSGSVSLELLFHRKPSVIVYRVHPFAYLLQDVFRTARYISLPNLLASDDVSRRPCQRLGDKERDRLPLPEYLAVRSCSQQVADRLRTWLDDANAYQAQVAKLDGLAKRYVQAGASDRAAARILETVRDRRLDV